MIKKILLSLLVSTSCYAGPILWTKGAGLSEYSIVFARQNIADLLSTCLNEELCSFSSPVPTQALKWLIDSKDLFPDAVFKTSAEIGSAVYRYDKSTHTVWFNQELLWLDSGKTVAYEVPDAVSLWMDALAQVYELTPRVITELKTQLTSALKTKVKRYSSSTNVTEALDALTWSAQDSDHIVIRDPRFQTSSPDKVIAETIQCEDGSSAKNLKFRSARWASILQLNKNVAATTLELIATWKCPNQVPSRARIKLQMQLERTEQASPTYSVLPYSFKASLEGE